MPAPKAIHMESLIQVILHVQMQLTVLMIVWAPYVQMDVGIQVMVLVQSAVMVEQLALTKLLALGVVMDRQIGMEPALVFR